MDDNEIELPKSIAEYAAAVQHSRTSVSRAIRAGALKVDQTKRPMQIVAGRMPLTIAEWRREIAPALATLKPALWGWDSASELQVLVGTEVHKIKFSDKRRHLPGTISRIAQFARMQRE